MNSIVSYSPIDGRPLGTQPVHDSEAVACAVQRAREAATAWASRTPSDRCAALNRLRLELAQDADSLTQLVQAEIGKPLQEAYGADLLPSLNALEWLSNNAPRLLRPRKLGRATLSPQPFGVVGVIGTWNYPLFLNVAPIAWALAAGNAVVWKPSELAAETAAALAARFERAQLPVYIVFGAGETGAALCRSGCDKIVFTGSAKTGRKILAELARTGTPSVMELSGNDAALVCADAEVSVAARSLVWGRLCNAGQSCVAPQRIYVVPEVYEAFVAECQRTMERLRVETELTPLRTEALRCGTHELAQEAMQQGAQLRCGGYPLADRPGYYYAPTLLTECTETMRVVSEDFFGPVLPVCRVANEAEAVARTNQNEMALGASVWTRDRQRGARLAAQLQVGMVSINEVLLDAANPALPFGGLRSSGFGKQRGAAGLEEFVQWKTIVSHSSGGARRHLFPYRLETLPILRGLAALKAAQSGQAKVQALRALLEAARRWK